MEKRIAECTAGVPSAYFHAGKGGLIAECRIQASAPISLKFMPAGRAQSTLSETHRFTAVAEVTIGTAGEPLTLFNPRGADEVPLHEFR